ncbi:hypothetical protein COO60DRAFT_788584 [Scenedesmus sp. NREL 46B-D3]|nr:hypothetical protein COO60DRAFT_788584 [Scenedesmus sp. NREL 46B-D3]
MGWLLRKIKRQSALGELQLSLSSVAAVLHPTHPYLTAAALVAAVNTYAPPLLSALLGSTVLPSWSVSLGGLFQELAMTTLRSTPLDHASQRQVMVASIRNLLLGCNVALRYKTCQCQCYGVPLYSLPWQLQLVISAFSQV